MAGTAGRVLTEAQEQAIRDHVAEVSETTRSVGFSCDDDGGHSGRDCPAVDHGVGLGDGGGDRWTVHDGCNATSNNASWWLHHTDPENNGFESTDWYTEPDRDRAWPTSMTLPAEVTFDSDTGGGSAWGYEQPYVLVK
jgi:hypothetical protein